MGQIIQYYPEPPPIDADNINNYLLTELIRISSQLEILAQGQIDTSSVEPDKPRQGMIRLADGNNWNPGAGPGYYIYMSSAWHKIITERIVTKTASAGVLVLKGNITEMTREVIKTGSAGVLTIKGQVPTTS